MGLFARWRVAIAVIFNRCTRNGRNFSNPSPRMASAWPISQTRIIRNRIIIVLPAFSRTSIAAKIRVNATSATGTRVGADALAGGQNGPMTLTQLVDLGVVLVGLVVAILLAQCQHVWHYLDAPADHQRTEDLKD